MKVVMLTNVVAPDKLGGLERYVRELSAALVRRGREVTVVSKSTSPELVPDEVGDDGVRILRYAAPQKSDPLFALKYPRAISSAVRKELAQIGSDNSNPDTVVHGHFPLPMLALRRQRTPYVYTFHAPVHKEILGERQGTYRLPRFAQTPAVNGLRLLEASVLRRAAHVTTLSRFVHDEMAAMTGSSTPPWTLIPGGLDTERFSPGLSGDVGFANRPLIVAARRLVERTGVENLVAAMPDVLSHHPTTQLVITGDGPRGPHIARYISDHGLGENVHLLGRVSDDELLALYRAADLTVTPTFELEGFGLSTAESMACGTPALVTPVGANPEVVRELGDRFIAASYSGADIATRIITLLDDPGYLAEVRSKCRDIVHPSMSWDHVAEQFCKIYDETLHERGVARASKFRT